MADRKTTEERTEVFRQSYNRKYGKGAGWIYDDKEEREKTLAQEVVLPSLPKPADRKVSLLEIGCGEGWHASLFAFLGLQVTAVDLSEKAIENAEKRSIDGNPRFLCRDAALLAEEFPPASFDVILARGLSWFHYNLTGVQEQTGRNAEEELKKLLPLLRPGGRFVLSITTDYSGDIRKSVLMHTADSLWEFCSRFGEVLRFTDWHVVPVDPNDPFAKQKPSGALLVVKTPE